MTATSSSPAWTAPLTSLTSNSRSEEHTSELQARLHLVCRLLLGKKSHLGRGECRCPHDEGGEHFSVPLQRTLKYELSVDRQPSFAAAYTYGVLSAVILLVSHRLS